MRRFADSELDVLEQAAGESLADILITGIDHRFHVNITQERKRVKVGKPAKIKDLSMQDNYQNNSEEHLDEDADSEANAGHRPRVGDQAFLDLTDRCNEDFVYIY